MLTNPRHFLRFVFTNGVSDGSDLTVCESGSGCWGWAVGFDLAAAGDRAIWVVGLRIFVNILLGLATWGDSAGASVSVTPNMTIMVP